MLGETENLFASRYGSPHRQFDLTDRCFPLLEGAVTRTYVHAGWLIRVAFLSGIAVREEFHKVPGSGRGLLIGTNDVDDVLRKEMGQSEWIDAGLVESLPPLLRDYMTLAWASRTWVRADHTAAASVGHNRMRLRIDSVAAMQYERLFGVNAD